MSDTEPVEIDDDEGLDVDLDDIDTDDEDLDAAGEEMSAEQIAKIQAENLRLRKENQRNRERWQPFERVFAGVDEEDAIAIARFAQTYASGNRAEAVRWLAQNAVTIAGEDLRAELEEFGFTKKEAAAAAKKVEAEQDNPTPLTAEDVAKMIAAERARDRAEAERAAAQQADVDGFVSEIDAALRSMDVEPQTDEAEAVVAEASRMYEKGEAPDSVKDLIAEAKRRVVKRSAAMLQREQQRRQKAANGAPGPDGPAPRLGSGMDRRDVIAAKLEKDKMSRIS